MPTVSFQVALLLQVQLKWLLQFDPIFGKNIKIENLFPIVLVKSCKEWVLSLGISE